MARISPLSLKASEQVRLGPSGRTRSTRRTRAQLVGPVRKGTDPASTLVEILRTLVPPAEGAVVSQAGTTRD